MQIWNNNDGDGKPPTITTIITTLAIDVGVGVGVGVDLTVIMMNNVMIVNSKRLKSDRIQHYIFTRASCNICNRWKRLSTHSREYALWAFSTIFKPSAFVLSKL